jgi:hypothetical protein
VSQGARLQLVLLGVSLLILLLVWLYLPAAAISLQYVHISLLL